MPGRYLQVANRRTGVHAVTLVLPALGAYVPAAHKVHIEAPCAAYEPAKHVTHVVCKASGALPAEHGVHCVEPFVVETVPGAHSWHADAVLAPSIAEAVPAEHGVQATSPATAKVPAAQTEHAVPLYMYPAGHVGVDGRQFVSPASEVVPSAHGLHETSPGAATDPAKHISHDD